MYYMKLSKTELRILEQIAKGIKEVKQIALALGKSKYQIYISKIKEKRKAQSKERNGKNSPRRTRRSRSETKRTKLDPRFRGNDSKGHLYSQDFHSGTKGIALCWF